MNKNRTITIFTAGLLLSFIGVTLFSMIYMAKDNNYDNTIYQYFNISKAFYSRLIYLNVNKDTLVNGMNFCSLSFIICNYVLSYNAAQSVNRFSRKIRLFLLLFWVLQAVLYNTFFYEFVYFGGLGFLPDPVAFRSFYHIFHQITVIGNGLTLFAAFLYLLSASLKKEPIKELRYIKWSFTVIDMGICLLYLYMFDFLPASFLWVSRSVGYISYQSLEMNSYIRFMRIIPYLTVIFILILWINLYRYDKMIRRLKDEEYVFSSIVASSEISTRAFSHYVKNELLSIISETEWIMKDPARQEEGLQNIRAGSLKVYERLDELQKNSNRIVLNQSQHNILAILEQSLADNKSLFSQNHIQVRYLSDSLSANVFCDAHYIAEVFQNIYTNAMDAMNAAQCTLRELTIKTTLYENQIRIQISDTGPGISPSVCNRLFEPFVSTKSTKYNWGIGLSFSKRIISCHNGKIEAANQENGGAIFTIYLPVLG